MENVGSTFTAGGGAEREEEQVIMDVISVSDLIDYLELVVQRIGNTSPLILKINDQMIRLEVEFIKFIGTGKVRVLCRNIDGTQPRLVRLALTSRHVDAALVNTSLEIK